VAYTANQRVPQHGFGVKKALSCRGLFIHRTFENLPARAAIATTTPAASTWPPASTATWATASAITHRRTSAACTGAGAFNTIEVRLAFWCAVVVEIAFATFDDYSTFSGRSISAAHLRALFFQDSLAG
jgi:hypothetical protein